MSTHRLGRRRRGFRALAAGLTVAVTVATLATTGTAATAAKCKAPSTVNFGQVAPGTFPTHDIAIGLGAYKRVEKRCKTTVNFVTFGTPQLSIAAQIAGQVQFTMGSVLNYVSAAAQGQVVQSIMTYEQFGQGVLVTSAANKSRGTGLQALTKFGDGSTWALLALGSSSQALASDSLRAAGVDPAKVNFLAVGIAGLIPAITSGRADMAVMTPLLAGQIVAAGQGHPVVYLNSEEQIKARGYLPGAGLAVNPDFAKQYPQLTKEIVAAELRGMQFLHRNFNDPRKVYELEPDAYKETTSFSAYAAGWEWLRGGLTTTGLIDQTDIQNAARFMQKYNLLPASFTVPSGMASGTYLKGAYKLLGQDAPTEKTDTKLLDRVPT
jgi:ABC-type nitrate/sulfonate/bicarbonate transport system substrate-binding protein